MYQRKTLLLATMITVALLVLTPTLFCQKYEIKKVDPQILYLQTDLKVTYIATGNCWCEQKLEEVNAMLISAIEVGVFNDGKFDVDAELEVKYYDLRLSKWISKKITIAPFKGGAGKILTVVTTQKLIRKSSGITAKIKITSTKVKDKNNLNNIMISKACKPIPPK